MLGTLITQDYKYEVDDSLFKRIIKVGIFWNIQATNGMKNHTTAIDTNPKFQ